MQNFYLIKEINFKKGNDSHEEGDVHNDFDENKSYNSRVMNIMIICEF